MLKTKYYGHKGGSEYCQGFVDITEQWNNGFYCPRWGDADQQYCCGADNARHCCPPPQQQQDGKKLENDLSKHIPLIAGVTVSCIVIIIISALVFCNFCRCCWGYKKIKRLREYCNNSRLYLTSTTYRRSPALMMMNESARSCNVLAAEYLMTLRRYPSDDPPPYAAESMTSSFPVEKQPLNDVRASGERSDVIINEALSASARASDVRPSKMLDDKKTDDHVTQFGNFPLAMTSLPGKNVEGRKLFTEERSRTTLKNNSSIPSAASKVNGRGFRRVSEC